MSDLLPTREQEEAALNISDCETSYQPTCSVEDVALLLAEREEALRVVICRLRACLHHAIMDASVAGCVLADTHNEAYAALVETVQYEVMK